jgi:hypothetical protein
MAQNLVKFIPITEMGVSKAKVKLNKGTKLLINGTEVILDSDKYVIGELEEFYDDSNNELEIGAKLVFTKDHETNQLHCLLTVIFGKVKNCIISLTSRIPVKMHFKEDKIEPYFIDVSSQFDSPKDKYQTWLDVLYNTKPVFDPELHKNNKTEYWSSKVSTPFYNFVRVLTTNPKGEVFQWLNKFN